MLEVRCNRCFRTLEAQGALVFSPPESLACVKYHVCRVCWLKLIDWLNCKPSSEEPKGATTEATHLPDWERAIK